MTDGVKKITIVGMGPGSPDYLTPAALEAVKGAAVIAGSKNLFALIPDNGARKIPIGGDVEKALDEIERSRSVGDIAILVSGDPGVFSFSKLVVRRFGADACRVIPGVSSVQLAFAAVGLDWQDAKIISAHAADPEVDIDAMAAADKIAVLGGREASLPWIADFAKRLGDGRAVFVCENLSLENERIYESSVDDLAALKAPSRVIILLIKREKVT